MPTISYIYYFKEYAVNTLRAVGEFNNWKMKTLQNTPT